MDMKHHKCIACSLKGFSEICVTKRKWRWEKEENGSMRILPKNREKSRVLRNKGNTFSYLWAKNQHMMDAFEKRNILVMNEYLFKVLERKKF